MIRIGFIAAMLVSSAASAADWPHVRGPVYDAHSVEGGLADHWPTAGPPVLWTRELGPGYSAVIVAESRAFTLFQSTGGMFLIALDADTGAELWKERIDWPWQAGGMYPGAYASPTWNDGKVFYATPTGIVGCVRAADGHSLWTVNVHEKFGSRGTEFGFASTPTVEEGRVFLPVGGPGAAMVALSAADGSALWTRGDDPASYCPALPITLDGRRLIVGFFQNSLVLFDTKTGERVWRERFSNNYDEHAAWPLFDGRQLMIASPFRVGSQLYRFSTADSKLTAKPVWSGRQFSNDVCSSVLIKGSVYGFDLQQYQASVHRPAKGAFKCLDFATGQVNWETDAVGQASAIAADGKLILWTETGSLLLTRANPVQYEELARFKVLDGGGMCWAAPALCDKRLYVRDHQRVVCLYLGSPADLDPARSTITMTATGNGFDWTRLLPKEPDFPNDEPAAGELGIWFVCCVAAFAVAALVSALLCVCYWRIKPRTAFAAIAFALGAVGTTAIGYWFDFFALTWPVSLYVAFRAVISLGLVRSPDSERFQILPRLALVLFAALCYGYYRLCLVVGYAMGWGFLGGFLPAMPFAVIAVRTKRRWLRWLAEALGFAAYFWFSGQLPGWKAVWNA